ncbi:coiled-coil domain-containing protein 50-like isoform X1 [Macrobrachium nipponense]|uniref:coiled-coil domain-containing protein 50-like isoform X1 n=1 Tax=Macrobrachium nipponense TaxID=159736 RepID=UPI0030C84FA8
MAEFQVQAMSDGKLPEDLPQRGRVNEVCREWLMHEDQALAYRLQSEEYQMHLGSNRERNQILRQDAPKAREEQIREDHEAAMAQTAYELSLAQQEARDAALANALARKLNVEEEETRKKQEEEDMAYARNLLEREKETIRQTRELRQVEREAAYLGINTGNDNVALLARKEPREGDLNTSVNSDQSGQACAVSSDLSDLSDFCLQPTDDMDEEEQRSWQEDQDAELARFLQEQDGKRRGDMLHQDQLMAIEAQDRELAKVLQEQERAKAKKAREKARQKALQKKMARSSQLPENDVTEEAVLNAQPRRHSSPLRAPHDEPGPSHYSRSDSPSRTDFQSSSPTYASPDSPREDIENDWQAARGRPLQRPNSLDLPGTSQYAVPHEPRSAKYARQFPVGKTNKPRLPDPEVTTDLEGESSSSIEPSPAMGFTNIACAIDPTYQRRVMRGELAASPQTTLQSTSSSSSTSSGTGGIIPANMMSPISPLPPPVFEDDDDYPVPPYMPIQGQRRTASLEKNRRLKPSKEKSKESCKQQ